MLMLKLLDLRPDSEQNQPSLIKPYLYLPVTKIPDHPLHSSQNGDNFEVSHSF